MEPAIAVDGLVKRYRGRTVVDGLSLTVAAGTVLALVGPNGAGKTTTVECVEGFRVPDAGRVRVLGCDPRRDRDAVVARMGVMLQEGGAYQAASPREMVRLYASFHIAPADPDDLLERLGLAAVATARYRTLSGGQKQRLNLALALVGRPEVAILDEPTAGMDPQVRRDTWRLLDGLRDDGATVLLTTHAMDEAEHLADRVAVIDAGRLVAAGTPAELAAAAGGAVVVVTTPARVDAAALAAAVGAPVEQAGTGRLVVRTGAAAIPRVTAFFADHGLPLHGVSAGALSLEDAYLRLLDRNRGPA